MEQDNAFSDFANPASISRLFIHHRNYPDLPKNYEWSRQKERYCPKKLLNSKLPGPFKLAHKFGQVFCHRGLYERVAGIIDNSTEAIDNGIRHGFFLHEADAIVLEQFQDAFTAHDYNPRRVTSKTQGWERYSISNILETVLVTRSVDIDGSNFATSYLPTAGKIPSLLDLMWKESQYKTGITLQIDLREQDFAEAIAYYSYHISKKRLLYPGMQGVHNSTAWNWFKSTILKGYSKHYRCFHDLQEDVKRKSIHAFGSDYFEIRHLHVFPPLMMVFHAKWLVDFACATTPIDDAQGDRQSYKHIRQTLMKQVLSFVAVGAGSYNFILEIVHSGLGLGYDESTGTARNPLTGALLSDSDVIFDSRVDRAMIDVSLELREKHPQLIFASCTRLPDVITPDAKYKASHETAKLVRWDEGEKGISAKLRAIHGGLYPQCQLVVADDPAAEIAARTWIDEELGLDRSELLGMTYYEWLAKAPADVAAAIKNLNEQDFMPNRFGYPTTPELGGRQLNTTIESNIGVMEWLKGVQQATPVPTSDARNDTRTSFHDEEGRDEPAMAAINHGTTWNDDRCRESHRENILPSYFSSDVRSGPVQSTLVFGKRYYKLESVANWSQTLVNIKLYQAAQSGNYWQVRIALENGANIHACSGSAGTPLVAACSSGHVKVVKVLLEKLRQDPSNMDESGYLHVGDALHRAAVQCQERVVALLLDSGANVHSRTKEGFTALEMACRVFRESSIIDMLRAKGGEFNASDMAAENASALQQACRRGNLYLAHRLLREGAVIEHAPDVDETFSSEIRCLLGEMRMEREKLDGTRLTASQPEGPVDDGMAHRDIYRNGVQRRTARRVHRWKRYAIFKLPPVPKAPKLRDCGCVICFVDNRAQATSPGVIRCQVLGPEPLSPLRPLPRATVTDPVAVTLTAMGRRDLAGLVEDQATEISPYVFSRCNTN
ncbi:ankyrin repeat-containing domain [Cordyceps militaris CM01]|uniref:Ankyrin repeat-containing domain n=1 Tax=Cordyceps militaris (strain CM01) TaxID=983644 RepID=G3JIV2_CORMM|nr:ankyrin repeat-containing domain [Cordyceps militaris CM01]EGX91946.1 ankyrin repeat-containing domain [Cordyceps militaris CM01]